MTEKFKYRIMNIEHRISNIEVRNSIIFYFSKLTERSNDRNSKIQTMSRPGRFWSLSIGIYDLFVIWCLEFVILDTKLQGKAGKL